MNNENNNFNQNNGFLPNDEGVNNNLDNTLNIKPDVNISDALNNNQVQSNNTNASTVDNKEVLNSDDLQSSTVNNGSSIQDNNNLPLNETSQNDTVISNQNVVTQDNSNVVNTAQAVLQPESNINSNPLPESNIATQNKKSSTTTILFIILGIVIFLIIAFLGCVLLYKIFKGSSDNPPVINRTTEYESTKENTTTRSTTKGSNIYDTFEYNGFTFNKESGYIYSTYINNGKEFLKISNLDILILIIPLNGSFSNFKSTDLTSQLTNSTMTASNRKLNTYEGIEMTTYEVSYNSTGEKLLTAYSNYPNNDFTMCITVENLSGEIDYDDMKKVATILNNSSFNGDPSKFSNDTVVK